MQNHAQVSFGTQPPPPAAVTVELGAIAQAVDREMNGLVPAEKIDQLLRKLLEQDFCDARVTTFLPIFLHRFACDALRAQALKHSGVS